MMMMMMMMIIIIIITIIIINTWHEDLRDYLQALESLLLDILQNPETDFLAH